MKKLICSLLLIALLVPDTAAAHDEDWHCVWVDNKKQPWGYHAGVDSFKYNAIDYDAAVLGGIAGAAIAKEKVLGGALGAAAGSILGYQFDRNRKPQEPYMKCTPKY